MKQGLILNKLSESSVISRKDIYNFYFNKYYNLFMNHFNMKGIDYQQKDFILRKFWADGKVACFNFEEILVFTPYASMNFNIYDYPVDVNLINTRGVKFIPSTPLKVDKEVVIGYIQRNKKSVAWMVDYYVRKITDVEMTIRTNLKAQKTPWLIAVTPESEAKMRNIVDNIEKDEPNLFIDLEDSNAAKSLVSGANYNIDKLYSYKCSLENELKEYLGFNNMGLTEKKEHLINSEVESNNEIVASSGDCFFDVLKEFFDRINLVFNKNLSVELNKAEEYMQEEENENDA